MKYIYKITNLKNNKIYIGKTTQSIEKRFKEHLNEAARYKHCVDSGKKFNYESRLYAAMYKYGTENFQIDLLSELSDDIDINQKEKDFIDEYNTLNPAIGYNISPGGLGGPLFRGHRHPEKTKALISHKSKGKKQSLEFIQKRLQSRKFIYQNLTTGEAFEGFAAAKEIYPNDNIHYAVNHNGKTNGHFWIKLPVASIPMTIESCIEIVAERDAALHKRYSDGAIKGWKDKSDTTKKLAIAKAKKTAAATRANRSEEDKALISKHISEAQKGKKASAQTIEKLKQYYRTASKEALQLRNRHNSEGQKGKKRYMNIVTNKHKMFSPECVPEGWVLLPHKGGGVVGKRKYRNKLTGECKMFYPESVNLDLWEKLSND